ncbi:hypothetical protein T11_16867 [Trichinella zimbabwensis]|uniref:Uncharacterized protein n=1 Tax=Trichinella zimbabwensis TaxID=268475 RepID=A0A0V1HVT9_9BILA|nr:hypothetical protein T11_16867 [Trichinella zimbabwensis]
MCVLAEPRMSNCRFYSYNPPPPMLYNPTQLSESFKGYHGPSTDLHFKYLSLYNSQNHCQNTYFMHYVFTQIFRYSHAVLNCASMKTDVWTCPDQLTSLDQASGIAGPVLP